MDPDQFIDLNENIASKTQVLSLKLSAICEVQHTQLKVLL